MSLCSGACGNTVCVCMGVYNRGCICSSFVYDRKTHKRKSEADDWILEKFGKILSLVLEMVLWTEDIDLHVLVCIHLNNTLWKNHTM